MVPETHISSGEPLPMMNRLESRFVCVVDDDRSTRRALVSALRPLAVPIVEFAAGEDFLRSYDPSSPVCLVLDLDLPGMSGLDLLHSLHEIGLPPTLVLTAYPHTEHVVLALQRGACDLLVKPPEVAVFRAHVQRLLDLAPAAAAERSELKSLVHGRDRLTTREQQVFELMAGASSTKEIATRLGISLRTAHVHRTHVLTKFNASSAAQIAMIAARLRLAACRCRSCVEEFVES